MFSFSNHNDAMNVFFKTDVRFIQMQLLVNHGKILINILMPCGYFPVFNTFRKSYKFAEVHLHCSG